MGLDHITTSLPQQLHHKVSHALLSQAKSIIYFCTLVGVGFILNGAMRENNSVVAWTEIGEGADALMCLTDKTDCCDSTEPIGASSWYHPIGGTISHTMSNEPYYQTYRKSSILLEHQSGNVPTVNGVFHCEVVDNNGMMQRLYIGIYPSSDSINRKFHLFIIPE